MINDIPLQGIGVDPNRPMIALTFDDGPSKYTPQILDTLEKYGCRATFFTLGNRLISRTDTAKRARKLGCDVLGHTWDHRDMTTLTEDEIRMEFDAVNTVLRTVSEDMPMLYRPPYGAVNDTVKSVSAAMGYAIINWSIDPYDWKVRDAGVVHAAVMSEARDKAIVLSHDVYKTTAEAYGRIIPELCARGYQLVTVSEMMRYSGIAPVAGTVYTSAE